VYVVLGDELISFKFDDKQAEQQFGLLFCDWPKVFRGSPPSEYCAAERRPLSLSVQAPDAPDPAPDSSRLIFADQSSRTTVLQDDRYWYIYSGVDAVARIPFRPAAEEGTRITVQIARSALSAGRLEDILFSSLAPVLRRRGLFMIHAFAAEKDDGATLLVGESGCGKTTTGLRLILDGWHYLANDVVLLRKKEGSVFALPTPGGIGLDAHSLGLLSGLTSPADSAANASKDYYPATELVAGWGVGTHVSRILFPRVEAESDMDLRPMNHSMTLARLMEASVDRWDTTSLNDHLNILELLSRQAEGFELKLGRELQSLPGLLDPS
jgi:hypothetical protein